MWWYIFNNVLIGTLIGVSTWAIQKSNYSVSTFVSKGVYQVKYLHNNTEYIILLPVKRGPKKIFKITDKNGTNVSSKIVPFLGPNEDFHANTLFKSTLDDEYIFHTIAGEKLHAFDFNTF